MIQNALAKIHFTDDELKEIEGQAKTQLGIVSTRRNKELDDLHVQRKKAYADLDYLLENKMTLLRTNTMSIQDIKTEEGRFTAKLADIDTKIKAHEESAREMLDYTITFSELVKNAALYYKHALDSEKREIVTQVFSELSFMDGNLVKYTAKEGFGALLERGWLSGSASRART